MTEEFVEFGWIPDASVGDVVRGGSDVFEALPFVVVAVIDSATSLSATGWAQAWSRRNPRWALSTDPLVVSGTTLCELAVELDLFTGFDEIWVPQTLPGAPPPHEVSLTSPVQLTDDVPSHIREWFQVSGWRLGLGDGFGLNFVSSDEALARALGLAKG